MRKREYMLLSLLCLLLSACGISAAQREMTETAEIALLKTSKAKERPTHVPSWTVSPYPTFTPTETLSAEEMTPGFKPEAWTIYPYSKMGIAPPNAQVIRKLDIHDIEEDSQGVLWFGTSYGLVRFDGSEWQLVVEHKGCARTYVEIGNDDSIWLSMSDGIYQYQDGSIQQKLVLSDDCWCGINDLSISPTGDVWIIIFDTSKWRDSIRVFSNHEWKVLAGPPPAYSRGYELAFDNNGDVYVSWTCSTYFGGISYYGKGDWTVFGIKTIESQDGSDGTPFAANSLIVDDRGHLWFYEWRTGLYEYNNGVFNLRAPHFNFVLYHATSIAADHEGRIWLGTPCGRIALAIYKPGDDRLRIIDGSDPFSGMEKVGHFCYYKKASLIPFGKVTALHVDSSNRLWIATDLGVYVLDLDAVDIGQGIQGGRPSD